MKESLLKSLIAVRATLLQDGLPSHDSQKKPDNMKSTALYLSELGSS